MSSENTWSVTSISLNKSEHLIIEAEPSYGNRKKWEGEMQFYISPSQLNQLREQLEDRKAKKELVKAAVADLNTYSEELKASYNEKKQAVAEQLNISVNDIPSNWGWDF